MTTVFIVLGVLVALIALSIWGFYHFQKPQYRHLSIYRFLYPYERAAAVRKGGKMIEDGVAAGKIPAGTYSDTYIECLKSTKPEHYFDLRDAMVEMNKLPTVQKGLKALGKKSMFEIADGTPYTADTPYTHNLQRPYLYIPGVPAQQFYDASQFEWTKTLEDAYPVIKKELEALLAEKGAGFKSYITENATAVEGWNTFNFWFFGKKYEENCAKCPETTKILESLPRFEKDHIMFSALNPHTKVPPHYGPLNGIIRAHLPMIVPPDCAIKVGGEIGTWEEGKIIAFDDSFLHEAWNNSDRIRIVLFLNFWHPCFEDHEIPVLNRFRHAYEQHPVTKELEKNQEADRDNNMALETVPA